MFWVGLCPIAPSSTAWDFAAKGKHSMQTSRWVYNRHQQPSSIQNVESSTVLPFSRYALGCCSQMKTWVLSRLIQAVRFDLWSMWMKSVLLLLKTVKEWKLEQCQPLQVARWCQILFFHCLVGTSHISGLKSSEDTCKFLHCATVFAKQRHLVNYTNFKNFLSHTSRETA